jgi:hypothetical protein
MMRKIAVVLALVAAGTLVARVSTAQDARQPVDPAAVAAAEAVAKLCAPLVETDCVANTACVWLPGYKVASGQEVVGYCRPAPKPLTARRPPAAAPQ